jgi:hypothetical protein
MSDGSWTILEEENVKVGNFAYRKMTEKSSLQLASEPWHWSCSYSSCNLKSL